MIPQRNIVVPRIYYRAKCSSTAQNYWTIISGAESHGKCATFGVWVEAFGAKLLFLFNKKDRFGKPSNLLQ